MLVVDASVLADDGQGGERARARLHGERLAAPELVDLEVASVLRRQLRVGALDTRRADLALTDLDALAVQRAPHQPLLPRCWQLRDNLTIYDAAYVALAEALGAVLLTGDGDWPGRMAQVPGRGIESLIMAPGRIVLAAVRR